MESMFLLNVRFIVACLLVAAAIWVLISGLRNKKRISLIAIFILLIPAGVLGYFEYNYDVTISQLSVAVQKVSGIKDASLRCERMSEAFFDVWANTDVINYGSTVAGLKYDECDHLISWYKSDNKNNITENQIIAIHLLDVETMRVSGQNNPALQECLAMKNDAFMAETLGATPNQANYIAFYYREKLHSTLTENENAFC